MEEITLADLRAVKAALLGAVAGLEVATDYSSVQKALLANAAFTAANFTQPTWKGQLGELLAELILAPAKPKGDYAKTSEEESERFHWYWTEEQRLMRTSRILGLHRGDRAGNHILILPHDQIRLLLQDARCQHEAQALFEAANAKVDAKREAELDYRARVRNFRAAAKRHPEFGYFFEKHLLKYSKHPTTWAKVHSQLGELLQKYLPELLSK